MRLPDNQEPMMHKAGKYEVGKVADWEEAKQRQIRAILNKLTPTNFEKLFQQVKAVNIDNVASLTGVVSQMVDRAIMEHTYCEMYVNLCFHLAMEMPDFNEDNEKITFKRVLLNKCQKEFERGEREQEEEANKADEEGEIKQSTEEIEEKRVEARRRMLGNIRLTGELYKKKMLTEQIMHECIQKFLGRYQDLDGEDVEALCKLMSTIGEMIDHEKAKEHMDTYFERMKTLSNNKNLSSRVRFMLKDSIELRKNKWQQRRKVEGPRKIEAVHRDAAQERQAQVSRLDHASSINRSARRARFDFGPRGSTMLSSPNAQDVRAEERLSYEAGNQELMIKDLTLTNQLLLRKLKRWQWWFLVALNIFFLAGGQSAVVLIGRFYRDRGGNGKWMATLVHTAAFPILFIPLFLTSSSQQPSTSLAPPSNKILALIYFSLGVLISGNNMMYSAGLLYLPASTYSLICVTQLAFNAVFSYFINSQKFTASIINPVVVLSLSAALIAVNDDSEGPSGVSWWKYIIGLLCTLGASALYSLLLSLMQLSFQKALRREKFSLVLEMQIYTSLVATCVSIVGLFASGEWKSLHGEMEGFGAGRVSYVMTLVWTAVAWQIYSVGVAGLIFVVSSLFANVVSTVSFAVTPIAFVIVFYDKMNGIKVIAMLLALWSFVSYIYQNYSDDSKASRMLNDVIESHNDYHKARRAQNDVSAINIQQKGLIPSPQIPLLMMHKAEKYAVGKVADEEEAKQRQLRAILNKLTPTNFEKLFEQVKAVSIDNVTTLIGVVSQIFDRALMEPIYCEMYADFCCHLAGAVPVFNEDNEKITFWRVLVNKCQEEFERGEREQEEEANKADEEREIKQSAEEREEKRVEARRRMLGNIGLIGELYKKKMLTERVMHTCIQKLLAHYQDLDGEDVEALCKLMTTIGEMIDHEKAKEHMDTYFERMKTLSKNKNLSSRARFMLKDAIDLRKNKWQQRKKVEGPKKIEEVHRDAAQEQQAQVSGLGREGVSLSRQSLLTVGGATDASELKVESVGEGSTSVSSEISVPGIIVDTFETAHHAKLDESSLQNEELLHETVRKDEQGESKLPEVGFKQDVKSSEISSEPISLKSSELIKHTQGKQSGQDSDLKAITTSDEVLTLETAQRGLAELVECNAEIDGTTDFTDVGSSNGEKTSTLDVPSRSDSIGSKEVVTMSGISDDSDQQSAPIPTPDLLEAASKHEGEGAENFGAASVSKDKPSLDLSKAKITKGGKKKREKKLQKADAAGTTSDLYNAYKGPEEKKETVASTESTESTSNSVDMKQAPPDAVEVDAIASEKGGTSKAEPDDWEDAADVSTPKLEVSDNGQQVIGRLDNHDGTTDFPDVGSSNGEKTSNLDVPSRSDLLEAASKHEGEGAENFGGGLVSFAASVSKAKITKGGKKKRKKKRQKADAAGTTSDLYNACKGPEERKETVASTESTESTSHSGQQVIGRLDNHDKDEEVITAKKYSRDFLLKFAEQYNDLPRGFEITSDSEAFKSANDLPKGLIPSPQTPLLVMHKAEKKYEVGKVTDEEQAKQRQLKAILNKLTPQNFEKLFEQVKAVNIDNAATLTGVISQIFDKALMEPTFCEMYADFCCHLAGELPDFNEDNEKVTFKTVLLNKCQEEFERGEREQEEANKADVEGEIKQSAEEREEKRVKARRRMLGNIRLIGELYKKKMLTERIMYACIQKLLGQYPDPDEEDVEALCKLMSTIGVMIDHQKAKKRMDAYMHICIYFDRMKTLSNNMNLSSRVRFMLKDVIDLRKNKWQQRRKVEGPKKIEEVHRDAAQERAQVSRLGRASSINQSARRASIDFGPRGSTTLSSPNAQIGGYRGLPTQVRGYGAQDVRTEERLSYEARTLSGPREVRNPDRSFERSLATSSPPRGQGTDFPPNVPSEKVWPEERLRDMSMAAIKEFYSARDEKEVELCIKELNSPSFHPLMVSLWVTDSFERKDMEREILAYLLVNLTNSRDCVLSQAQLIKGFESVLTTLEDAVIDAPRAPEFLGRIFAKVVTENVIPLGEIGMLIHEGGEEPGRLRDSGLAADVLGTILETIKSEKGDSVLSEIRTSSNLRLEDFRPLDPNRSRKLEKFI